MNKESGFGKPLACSECFSDRGMVLEAQKLGVATDGQCPNCKSYSGRKLDMNLLSELASTYFVHGSIFNTTYGGANAVQCNQYHFGKTDINVPAWLKDDMQLIEFLLGIGFFYYAPRMYRLGHTTPIRKIEDPETRQEIINDIVSRFPERVMAKGETIYRLRKNPVDPCDENEFCSPPNETLGKGRLDDIDFPVLYGSQDIDICIHECRVTVEDLLYLGTVEIDRPLRLLDLSAQLNDGPDPFESLYISTRLIFSASSHAYPIIRSIARTAKEKGFDGIIYPSYFSQVHHSMDIIENIAVFGRPIKDGRIKLRCSDRLRLAQVNYEYHFGPAAF